MKITLKKYTGCNTVSNVANYNVDPSLLGVLTTYNGLWVSDGVYAIPPFDFAEILDPTLSFIVSWDLNLLGLYPLGTYPLSITGSDGNEYFIIVEVVSACELQTYTLDCCNALNIVWLNREGGYENFIFTGRRQIFEVEEGEAIEFKTSSLTRKNAQIENIYNAVIVNTGDIPKEHLLKLASLRSSIQAWVYTELPGYIDFSERLTPILIDRESIIINDTREKIVQRSVRFIVAKEVVTQSQ